MRLNAEVRTESEHELAKMPACATFVLGPGAARYGSVRLTSN